MIIIRDITLNNKIYSQRYVAKLLLVLYRGQRNCMCVAWGDFECKSTLKK